MNRDGKLHVGPHSSLENTRIVICHVNSRVDDDDECYIHENINSRG